MSSFFQNIWLHVSEAPTQTFKVPGPALVTPAPDAPAQIVVEPFGADCVDAHQHGSRRTRQPLDERRACAGLGVGRYGIFEVDDDGMRARRARLRVTVRTIRRHEQIGSMHCCKHSAQQPRGASMKSQPLILARSIARVR